MMGMSLGAHTHCLSLETTSHTSVTVASKAAVSTTTEALRVMPDANTVDLPLAEAALAASAKSVYTISVP